MTTKEQPDTKQTAAPKAPDEPVALAAIRRSAKKARQQAVDTDGYVATWRDGKIVHDTEPYPPHHPSRATVTPSPPGPSPSPAPDTSGWPDK